MRLDLHRYFKQLLESTTYTHESWKSRHLLNRDWREFERLVSLLWEDMGYKTHLGTGSADGGVDIIAEQSPRIPFSSPRMIAIQAKQWSKKIREPQIRDLYGVERGGHRHSGTEQFDESILVTSHGCEPTRNGFTKGAIQFAESNGVELIDGETLLELLDQSNLAPLSMGRKTKGKWHFRDSPQCGWAKKFEQTESLSKSEEAIFDVVNENIYLGPSETIDDGLVCDACMNHRLE